MTRSSSSMPLRTRPPCTGDAKLGKVSPDRIDHRGLPCPDEQMARAMEHQPALLLGGVLTGTNRHIGSCDRLTDGPLCVGRIVLLPFDA